MEKTKKNFKEIHFIYEEDPSILGFSIKLSYWEMNLRENKIYDFMELIKEEAEKNGIKKIKCIRDFYNNEYDNPKSKFYIRMKDEPLSFLSNLCPFTFKYEKEITISNSESVECVLNLTGVKDLTVQELKKNYLNKPQIILSYGDKILKDSDKLSHYMKTFTADRKLIIEKQYENFIDSINIKVCIQDIKKVEEFQVSNIDTSLSVKRMLAERLEIDISKIRFILKYKDQILDDTKPFNFYEIKTNSDLTLEIKQSGNKEAGIMFNDVTKNNFKILKPSKDAPDWRYICRGLNIEGICENKKCKAYNKNVFCPMVEFEIFDLILNSELVICPMCKSNFDAKTCAFYDCFYSFSGIKYDENNQQIKIANQEFPKVGKECKYLVYTESDLVKWKRLMIIVKFDDQPEIFCGVCTKQTNDLNEKPEKKECSHFYHDSCYRAINFTCRL